MKKKTIKLLFAVLSVATIWAGCKKDDHNHATPADDPTKEYKYIRVLVSDENTPILSLVNPFDGGIQSYTANFSKSAVYTTESNRYAAVVHRENNLTQTFDTGFEHHGDHIDVKGTPKFGAMIAESSQPTHFKSKKGELLIFNDGDGTLSVGNESDIHTSGIKMQTINAGLVKHHGAMATFSNGTYAVTEKDNSIAGSLPERVKIIDRTGKTLFTSTLATTGIHGNATDGIYAVFGSASGILVVTSDGQQKLIAHPSAFGTAWFGTILETSTPGKFIGYTAAKGVYLIDVSANTVSPVFENTDIMQCKTSFDRSKLGILLHSGDFRLFDLKNLTLVKDGKIIASTANNSTQKPQMELTNRFVYVTQPSSGELHQIMLVDFSKNTKIKVSNTPYRLTIVGHESNADH